MATIIITIFFIIGGRYDQWYY